MLSASLSKLLPQALLFITLSEKIEEENLELVNSARQYSSQVKENSQLEISFILNWIFQSWIFNIYIFPNVTFWLE